MPFDCVPFVVLGLLCMLVVVKDGPLPGFVVGGWGTTRDAC